MKPHVLVIDNHDSFTYNLVQALSVLGAQVTVRSSDRTDLDTAEREAPTHLVISPGPGRPEGAGTSIALVSAFTARVPILGVCLGHQVIAAAFGGGVGAARRLMHGKASEVHHDGRTIFAGLPRPFLAGRYHSLAVAHRDLPPALEVSATTSDGEIMGLRHRTLPVEGVQFHPESLLTPDGSQLLASFLGLQAPGRTEPAAVAS